MSSTNRSNKNKVEHVGRANLNTSNMISLSSSCLPASESISRSGGGNTRRHSSLNASSSHGAALGGRMGAVPSTSLLSTDNVSCLSNNNNNNNIEINDFNRTGVPGSTLNKQGCPTSADQQSSQHSSRLVEGGKCMDVSNGMEEGGGSLSSSSATSLKHGVSNSSSTQDIRFVHHTNLDIPTSSHCPY